MQFVDTSTHPGEKNGAKQTSWSALERSKIQSCRVYQSMAIFALICRQMLMENNVTDHKSASVEDVPRGHT